MEGTTDERPAGSEPTTDEMVRLRQASFEDFYRIHREPIFRALALTLRDRNLAAEAADEAMARAYQHWRTVSGHNNQPGWAYVVGLNWARGRIRRWRHEVLTRAVPDRVSEVTLPNPELDRALARLELQNRSIIVLRYFADWSYEEIASALRIPLGTVKSRIHRILGQIRDDIGEDNEP